MGWLPLLFYSFPGRSVTPRYGWCYFRWWCLIAFAASAQIKNSSQITGIVGDNGQLYLSGLPLEGVINIQWGDGVQQKCQANYKLPETELDNPVSYATLECR